MKTKAIILISLLLLGTQLKSQNNLVSVSTHDTPKHDVFILTDINLVGGDPDDRQSLIHLLWYADQLNIKAIVPDYWSGKGFEACMIGIDAYEKDYSKYSFQSKGYPSPDFLKQKIIPSEEEAIQQLVNLTRNAEQPLYVLVWGSMKTLKTALIRHPEIANKIRVLSIGTGLKYGPKDEVPGENCNVRNWNGKGRNEIYSNPKFNKMWWLESNWTYNGMFMGEGPKVMFEKLSKYGSMGRQIKEVTQGHDWAQYFRVGDTPSVLYLIDQEHNTDSPEINSWAGTFKKPFPQYRPNYFTDDNGDIDWDYSDPCNSWDNLQLMYSYNKSTLLIQRKVMYTSLLSKLDILYKTN